MSAEEIAEVAAGLHDLPVIYCTKEEELDELIQKHILEPDVKLVGLAFKAKMIKKAERKKKAVVVQFSTEKVTIVLHLGVMGNVNSWNPTSEAFASLMQNGDIRKVGLNVLQIVNLLRGEGGPETLDCKGVYDLIPMAQRIKAAALKKGKIEHKFPDMTSPQTINKDIWALADMALGSTDFKTPSDVHAARWEMDITASVIGWLSYEPIVARKVYDFLSTLEEDVENAKGPTALHVTNLPSDVTQKQLVEYFKCTSLSPPHIHTAKKNRSTANAAIYYNEDDEAKAAMDKYVGKFFEGREVLISETEEGLKQVEQNMQQDRLDFQVYMSNLPYFTTEEQLKRHFRHLGDEIREAKFYCHQDLGVGSVYFKTKEAASRAVEEFDNSPFYFAVSRYNNVTGEQEVTRKTRTVLLDLDFQNVIRKQKKTDRSRNKGEDEYDALDPYFSHQQRMNASKKEVIRNYDGKEPLVGQRIEDPPQTKAKMTVQGAETSKTKMRVVAGEKVSDDKVQMPDSAKSNPVEWLADKVNSEQLKPPTGVPPPPPPQEQRKAQPSPPALPASPPAAPPAARQAPESAAQAPPQQPPPQPTGQFGQFNPQQQQHQQQQHLLQQQQQRMQQQQQPGQPRQQQQQPQSNPQVMADQQRLQQEFIRQQNVLLQQQQQQAVMMAMQQKGADGKGKDPMQLMEQARRQQAMMLQQQLLLQQQMAAQQQNRKQQPGQQQGQQPMGMQGMYFGGQQFPGYMGNMQAGMMSPQMMQMGMGQVGGHMMPQMGGGSSSGGQMGGQAAGAQMAPAFNSTATTAAAAAGAPIPPPTGSTNSVHVIGIPYPCQEAELRKHFGVCGTIVECDIKQSKGGSNTSKGHATIAYSTPNQAQAAVDKLHRSSFKDHSLTVDLYRPRAARVGQQPLTAESFAGQDHEKVKFEKPKTTKVIIQKPPELEKKGGEAEEAT